MSIADLEKKFAAVLARQTRPDGLSAALPTPQRLLKRLEIIERRFDQLENNQPQLDKIRLAIEKLERDGNTVLTSRDWKNVAWGLCATLPNRPKKLIFLAGGQTAIQAFHHKPDQLGASVYMALLFSYFALTQDELQQDSSQWLKLRDLLSQALPIIQRQSKRPRTWMQPLNDYPELLQTQPTARLSMAFLNDPDDQKIPQLAEVLRISADSWFWEKLIKQAIQSILKLPDAEFLDKIERLLHLIAKQPTYTTMILSQTLDRYAQSSSRDQIHERLKEIALTQWSNPQYDSSIGWANVKPDTKQMVIQWFVRADLEAFFRLFNQDADERRFKYWMRFIKQISYSYIIFGKNSITSTGGQHREFLIKNKGRYGRLLKSTSDNNAFMLKIGNLFIVEFSRTGNATYLYSERPQYTSQYEVDLFWLKSGIEKMNHSGLWENNFDQALAKIGIFPDKPRPKQKYSTDYRH